MITAYIDFKSLDCFLAISQILKLAADCRTPVSWQPYRSKERALPTQVASESVTQTHHRVRRESERRLQQHYAELRGLNIDPSRGQIDTSAALGWLASVEGDTSSFVSRLFAAHWIDHADINDPTLLEELTTHCGLTRIRSAVDLDSIEREAEEKGLFDAPTFFIEGQMFMGRAHIPLMRQLLTDGGDR
jgi:2-hydroxychromene-2-carboxylate isomerase